MWDGFKQRALALDAEDVLAGMRDEFCLPVGEDGEPRVYLCGHSLGLQPRGVKLALQAELDKWAEQGVRGHVLEPRPWLHYHKGFSAGLADLVGAQVDEVVVMNTLSVNLHFLLASFYRPERSGRYRILVEADVFPSDRFVVESQVRWRGFEDDAVLFLEGDLSTVAWIEALERNPDIALVLLPGVQYLHGEVLDLAAISLVARSLGVVVGVDLAHGVGNVPLGLHDAEVDFAAWCHYKYMNSGPGAVAACFVHAKHHGRDHLAGWWGQGEEVRFQDSVWQPVSGAAAWQVSNPPIFSLAPLAVSLSLFHKAGGIAVLRQKSLHLTGFLAEILLALGYEVSPQEPERRGCQLSLRVQGAERLLGHLTAMGVDVDLRGDLLRVAPVPLYNSFFDVYRFARCLEEARNLV